MLRYFILLTAFAMLAQGYQLPDGAGRAETEKLCKQCHELARSISLRQDRDGWSHSIARMTAFGMKSTDQAAVSVLQSCRTR